LNQVLNKLLQKLGRLIRVFWQIVLESPELLAKIVQKSGKNLKYFSVISYELPEQFVEN